MWKFNSLTAWNNEDLTAATLKTNAVKDESILNKHIYNMTFFNGIWVWLNFINEFAS